MSSPINEEQFKNIVYSPLPTKTIKKLKIVEEGDNLLNYTIKHGVMDFPLFHALKNTKKSYKNMTDYNFDMYNLLKKKKCKKENLTAMLDTLKGMVESDILGTDSVKNRGSYILNTIFFIEKMKKDKKCLQPIFSPKFLKEYYPEKYNKVIFPDKIKIMNKIKNMHVLVNDLSAAFYSIPLHPLMMKCCAFKFNNTIYYYKRLPFGLPTSPKWLQFMLSNTLKLCKKRIIKKFNLKPCDVFYTTYMDDNIIGIKNKIFDNLNITEKTDLEKLVYDTIGEYNWTINESKIQSDNSKSIIWAGIEFNLKKKIFRNHVRNNEFYKKFCYDKSRNTISLVDLYKLMGNLNADKAFEFHTLVINNLTGKLLREMYHQHNDFMNKPFIMKEMIKKISIEFNEESGFNKIINQFRYKRIWFKMGTNTEKNLKKVNKRKNIKNNLKKRFDKYISVVQTDDEYTYSVAVDLFLKRIYKYYYSCNYQYKRKILFTDKIDIKKSRKYYNKTINEFLYGKGSINNGKNQKNLINWGNTILLKL